MPFSICTLCLIHPLLQNQWVVAHKVLWRKTLFTSSWISSHIILLLKILCE